MFSWWFSSSKEATKTAATPDTAQGRLLSNFALLINDLERELRDVNTRARIEATTAIDARKKNNTDLAKQHLRRYKALQASSVVTTKKLEISQQRVLHIRSLDTNKSFLALMRESNTFLEKEMNSKHLKDADGVMEAVQENVTNVEHLGSTISAAIDVSKDADMQLAELNLDEELDALADIYSGTGKQDISEETPPTAQNTAASAAAAATAAHLPTTPTAAPDVDDLTAQLEEVLKDVPAPGTSNRQAVSIPVSHNKAASKRRAKQ